MTRTEPKAKPCYACDTGTLHQTNLKGRAFDYRDEVGLEFDEDLHAPVCDVCGEVYLKGELTQRFSDVLDRLRSARKSASAAHFAERAEREFPDVSRTQWEEMLGLSPGYISRVATGARVPQTVLAMFLECFAREPETALRVVSVAGRMTTGLSDALARNERARRQSAAAG
jgi:hypothetical protein